MNKAKKMEHNVFNIIKYYATSKIQEKFVAISDLPDDVISEEYAKVKILFDDYNAKLRTRIKNIEKMKMDTGYIASELFEGLNIPFEKIREVVLEHPKKKWQHCYYEHIYTPFL